MRSQKRYTNQTFTKHETGRMKRAIPEPAVCKVCGDVYTDRRWTKPEAERKETRHQKFRPANEVTCPACQRQQEGLPGGFVHLNGKFLSAHHEEISRLLYNEAERAAEDNPLARIMGVQQEKDGGIVVTTTTEHLAQRLGHAIEKAFSGRVRYDFSHENKLAHVWWYRD